MALELLDEKGFVFLDESRRPFRCCMWEGKPWLFYWHANRHWVSLRPVTQFEVWTFPQNLTDAEQELYHDTHAKNAHLWTHPKWEGKQP